MTLLQSLTLGLVQGLTEFLPVSSSGHLILASRLLGWPDQGLAFDATVHLGTAMALLIYFWKDLRRIVRKEWRLAGVVLVSSFPAGFLALAFESTIETRFRSAIPVAVALIAGGIGMYLVDRTARDARTRDLESIKWGQGLLVGCIQVLALIPGVSRSGATIVGGLLTRMDRPTAARFAFLLGLPITAAAGVLKSLRILTADALAYPVAILVTGLAASFLSGLFAVWFLIRYLQRRGLTPFVVYRLALGGFILWLVR